MMTAPPSIDMSVWIDELLGQASPDMLRNRRRAEAAVVLVVPVVARSYLLEVSR